MKTLLLLLALALANCGKEVGYNCSDCYCNATNSCLSVPRPAPTP